MLIAEHMTPVMHTDSTGYASKKNSIFSLVYKEAYKTPEVNIYFFDYGQIYYEDKGRLLSNQTTVFELYALTTFNGFGPPFISTSIGYRVNFNKLSLYTSFSISTVSFGFATESGYGSFSMGVVGQTIFDFGVGFTLDANNQYFSVKAPFTLILVFSLSPVAAVATATASVFILISNLINPEEDYDE